MEVASACGVRSGEELRQTQVKLQMGGEGGRSVCGLPGINGIRSGVNMDPL